MPLEAPLVLEIATIDDIPAITDLWFTVFNDPGMNHLMPNTPGVRTWMTEANRNDMLHKPFQKYIKIVDPTTTDATGRPRIAAYAKWDLAMPDERGPRFPPWHADMPSKDCDAFFGKLEVDRGRVMGARKHYCMIPSPCAVCATYRGFTRLFAYFYILLILFSSRS
jgi:hypothetical protein